MPLLPLLQDPLWVHRMFEFTLRCGDSLFVSGCGVLGAGGPGASLSQRKRSPWCEVMSGQGKAGVTLCCDPGVTLLLPLGAGCSGCATLQ